MGDTTEGFKGNIEVGFTFIQNINDIFQSNNSANLHYIKKKHHVLSMTNSNLSVVNSNRLVNDGFQHFRYIYKLNDVFTPEAFTQLQHNQVLRIKARWLNGFGGRLALVEQDSVRLYFAALYMYEIEHELTGFKNHHHRFSNYISFGLPIGKQISLDFIGYYQPDINNPKDFRVSTQIQLDMRITEKFGFRMSGSWFYDSYPPEGIRNAFFNFRNSFRYTFN
jgi:hypothetical protein